MIQKIILTTDGTVTNLLSVLTGEKIEIEKIEQKIEISIGKKELCLKKPEPLLYRKILLLDRKKTCYMYAESQFVFDRLSKKIQYSLLESDVPIGLLWKEEKLEMCREMIGYYSECNQVLEQYFSQPPKLPFLCRSYTVIHDGLPFGIITEKFPASLFGDKISLDQL